MKGAIPFVLVGRRCGSSGYGWPTYKPVQSTSVQGPRSYWHGQSHHQHDQHSGPDRWGQVCQQGASLTERTGLCDRWPLRCLGVARLVMSECMHHVAWQNGECHCEKQYPCSYVTKAAQGIDPGCEYNATMVQ